MGLSISTNIGDLEQLLAIIVHYFTQYGNFQSQLAQIHLS